MLIWGLQACQSSDTNLPTDGTHQPVTSKTGELVILEYGMIPPYLYFQARQNIAQHYHLKFTEVAGCIVSESLKDSVKHENEQTEKLLKAHCGIKTLNELYHQIDQEYARYLKAEQGIQSDTVVSKEIPFIKEAMLAFVPDKGQLLVKVIQLKSTFSGAIHDTTHLIKIDTTTYQLTDLKPLKTL